MFPRWPIPIGRPVRNDRGVGSHVNSTGQSADSSPKWFTEVEFDLRNRWTESTIEYAPRLDFDDSAFTRVIITELTPGATPAATPAA